MCEIYIESTNSMTDSQVRLNSSEYWPLANEKWLDIEIFLK